MPETQPGERTVFTMTTSKASPDKNPAPTAKRPRVPLSQTAYERIKQKIVSLELSPGAVIDEASLRAELNLGRTPIREALQRLSQEKLVIIVPRRGMFVTEIGIIDLHRLFEMRLVLESLAARQAAQRGSDKHWQQMETVLAGLPEKGHNQGLDIDNEALITVDKACHEIMYAAADNEFLQDTLITLYALSLRLWHFSLSKVDNMPGAVLEHREILNALKARNGPLSAQLLEHHINAFQDEIQSVVSGTQNPNGQR